MTALCFDVATYMVLHHLQPSGDQKKVRGDMTTVAQWFGAMTQLTGALYKRYPAIEMKGLLNFITSALLKRSSQDLFILQVGGWASGFRVSRGCMFLVYCMCLTVCGCVGFQCVCARVRFASSHDRTAIFSHFGRLSHTAPCPLFALADGVYWAAACFPAR